MQLAAQWQTITASTLVVGGRGRLLGYSAQENAGSPAIASMPFYDGTSTGGIVMHRIGLAASGTANPWFGPNGIAFNAGLFAGAMAGSFVGVVYFESEELYGSRSVIQSNGNDARLLESVTLGQLSELLNGYK